MKNLIPILLILAITSCNEISTKDNPKNNEDRYAATKEQLNTIMLLMNERVRTSFSAGYAYGAKCVIQNKNSKNLYKIIQSSRTVDSLEFFSTLKK